MDEGSSVFSEEQLAGEMGDLNIVKPKKSSKSPSKSSSRKGTSSTKSKRSKAAEDDPNADISSQDSDQAHQLIGNITSSHYDMFDTIDRLGSGGSAPTFPSHLKNVDTEPDLTFSSSSSLADSYEGPSILNAVQAEDSGKLRRVSNVDKRRPNLSQRSTRSDDSDPSDASREFDSDPTMKRDYSASSESSMAEEAALRRKRSVSMGNNDTPKPHLRSNSAHANLTHTPLADEVGALPTNITGTTTIKKRIRSPSVPKDWFKKKTPTDPNLDVSAIKEEDDEHFDDNGNLILKMGLVHNVKRPVSGTVDALIDRLAPPEAQDMDYIKTFLLTFRHFLSAEELIDKLIERVSKVELKAEVRYRIAYPSMLEKVNLFIKITKEDDMMSTLSGQLERALEQHSLLLQQKVEETVARRKEKEDNEHKPVSDIGVQDLTTINLQALARQLTLIEFGYFKKVHPQEFMMYLWKIHPKEGQQVDLTPNLDRYTRWFNTLSYWAGTEICTAPVLKDRVAKLEIVIHLLKILLEINNFNVAMAIYSGLNCAAVQRLKQTWESIPSKSKSIMADLQLIMNPSNNYQKYRELAASKASSFVPFFGLVLKDLTFANDGNPKILANGLINFQKLWVLSDLVQKIVLFQSNSFKFERDETLEKYCNNLVVLPEDRLYKYSLLCEPRQSSEGHQTVRLVEKWQNSSGSGFLERFLNSKD